MAAAKTTARKPVRSNSAAAQRCPLGAGGGGVDIETFMLKPLPAFVYRPVVIYTDGGCAGNPGPGGWGAVIQFPDKGDPERELFGGEPDTTNNRMELTAAVRALDYLQWPAAVTLTTDSQYLRRGITEWLPKWVQKNWRRGPDPVKNRDLWEALLRAVRWHKVDWLWVRGHSGHPENERADRLAQKGIDEQQEYLLK